MDAGLIEDITARLGEIRAAGLYKNEHPISSPQGSHVTVAGHELLNFCANNYLGLANHPDLVAAAHAALDRYGFGMASVRFICGTQTVHRQLEQRLSTFLGMEDTILYSSCFDANGGLFEALLDERDAVISDALTTPRSSMGSGSARPGGCGTRIATSWNWRRGWSSPPMRATG